MIFRSWQQLELVSNLESDLGDTEDWRKKLLVDFSAENQLDRSNNCDAIDMKMGVSFL